MTGDEPLAPDSDSFSSAGKCGPSLIGAYWYLNQTAREDAGTAKPVVGDAARALDDWLRASDIQEGALFRRIRRGDVVAEAMNPVAVRRIVIERARLSGLEAEGYFAHSLRAGFLTEAADRMSHWRRPWTFQVMPALAPSWAISARARFSPAVLRGSSTRSRQEVLFWHDCIKKSAI